MHCPLCQTAEPQLFYVQPKPPNEGREYWQCGHCEVIFVPAEFQLDAAAEKAVYDQHQNDPSDAGYRAFLSQTLTPLVERLPAGAEGLDFGSGPGPTLSLMLEEAGFSCSNYDIYYANDPARLTRTYDFVTCTEVAEHLAQPQQVIEQLVGLLRPAGVLAIMTRSLETATDFATWGYRQDSTHITFYGNKAFAWIAQHWQLKVLFQDQRTVIFQRA
ncbi:MAG: class I SAM-dependent methyltransferase [Idiomarina sp.]